VPEGASLRPFWSGTLAFGLVSVPVELYPANRRERVSLRWLAADGTPLSRRWAHPETGEEIAGADLARGYPVPGKDGAFVVVGDDELAALAPDKSREIDLERFVAADEIDPAFFDRAYFLTPAGDSNKAYRLLARVLEETGRAGIATFVMRGRSYLVAILAERGILRAETLRYADELRTADDVGIPEPSKVPKAAVSRFRKAIRALAEDDLDRSELEDETAAKTLALAEAKRETGDDTVEVAPERDPEPREQPPDLMNVLKMSLERADRAA
jgi:DNA end-binding protein Ku